jgi:hypothetical protein
VTIPHLLTGDYLFNSPLTPPSIGFDILTAGFVVIFLFSAFAYWRRSKLARDNPALRRLIRRASKAGMWTGGIGIFLAAMRYADNVPYFSMPIWIYLLLLSMIAIVGYFVYDLSERYPLAVYELHAREFERRYRSGPKPAREPQKPRPRVRGKRRRA